MAERDSRFAKVSLLKPFFAVVNVDEDDDDEDAGDDCDEGDVVEHQLMENSKSRS